MTPELTVILPVHNSEQYLSEAIVSILNQTFEEFELLIINDGSKDKSGDIIKSFTDSRIRVVNHKHNKGLVVSLNEAIAISRGSYIARMDADDISDPNRFALQLQYLRENPSVDVVGSSVRVFGIDNYIWDLPLDPDSLDAHTLFRCSLAHPAIMMRKSTIGKLKLKYLKFHQDAEDFDLWSRLLAKGGRIGNIATPLLSYRTHDSQISHKNSRQVISTRSIYSWQLKNRLNIIASKRDLEMHHLIATLNISKNARSLEKKRRWLANIIQANNQTHAYKSDKLRDLCATYWMDNCYVSGLGPIKYIYLLKYPTTISAILMKVRSKIICLLKK
jgi:glycosyltransferase involved in cell wall biosynthesis